MNFPHEELIIGHFEGALFTWHAEYVKRILKKIVPIPLFTRAITPERSEDRDAISMHVYSAPQALDFDFHIRLAEDALLNDDIDVMIMPMETMALRTPYRLTLAAVFHRVQTNDALVSREKTPFERLPEGAKVGFYSLRQLAQLKLLRNDLSYLPASHDAELTLGVEGLEGYDAAVYPEADAKRLGFENAIAHVFSFDDVMPAFRQSAMGCVTKKGNIPLIEALKKGMDAQALKATVCENGFLKALNPPFDAPLGGYAEYAGHMLRLVARSVDPKTLRVFHYEYTDFDIPDPEAFGAQCAADFERRGGRSAF